MLTPEQMQTLKKVNLTKDQEKTRIRISEDYKGAAAAEKTDILKLSGLSRHAFYNAFKVGSATPRLVLSMAQVLDVSPFYYTGESDEKGSYSKNDLIRFLDALGYENIIEEIKSKRKTKRKDKGKDKEIQPVDADESADGATPFEMSGSEITEPVYSQESEDSQKLAVIDETCEEEPNSEDTNNVKTFEITVDNSRRMTNAVNELDEESAILLMKALFKRADAGGNAAVLSEIVKMCLLS